MAKPRSLLLFYILVGYVTVQFAWWSWLLIRQNNEIYDLKRALNLLNHEDPQLVIEKGNELEEKLRSQRLMIAGEGLIFVALLTIGFMRVRNSIRREQTLSRQQTNFMHSITHELKSPIASIRLAVETLRKYELDKDRRQEVLDNALSDTDRLNRLVDNILLSARIENKSHFLNRQRINLSETTATLLKRFTGGSHGLVPVLPPDCFANLDPDSFESILINLVENAMKYSPAGSVIRIILSSKENAVTLTVTDEGSGIPDEEKEKVMEKFYRVGSEQTRQTKGTGLGLYIVDRLVREQGGKVTIRNNTPRGTSVDVTFYV